MKTAKGTDLESLRYIYAILCELRDMADAAPGGMLGYLIEMALIEASDEIRNLQSEQGATRQKRDSAA